MTRKQSVLAKIREQFPSIDHLDWVEAFRRDGELYGNIWHDILKQDQAQDGRPGPRPALSRGLAETRFAQLNDEDFSMEEFPAALKSLGGNASVRQLASKTGLDRNLIYRLQTGEKSPDNYEMEVIATSFGRRPSFFLEYRIGYVLAMIHEHMLKYPESSVGPYRKVRDAIHRKAYVD